MVWYHGILSTLPNQHLKIKMGESDLIIRRVLVDMIRMAPFQTYTKLSLMAVIEKRIRQLYNFVLGL